jgi:hypothetical protein
MRRNESRPPVLGASVSTWGPWSNDVLLIGMAVTIDTTAGTNAFRRPRLTISLVGAGILAVFYGTAFQGGTLSVASIAAISAIGDESRLTEIDTITGIATYESLTSTVPIILPITADLLVPERATLAFDIIDAEPSDAMSALNAVLIDV